MTPVAANTVDSADYENSDKVDIPKRKSRLQEILRSITQPDLLNLADCFLADEKFMDKFCRAPAGVKLHHAGIGGLLDHTAQMAEVAVQIASLYPQLNRDLLIIGTFLHDIGKTEELGYENEFLYTNKGQMLGHPVLGLELLLDKIRETEKLTGEEFDKETAMLLKHLVLSHHGTYENQSVKLPMTLEAAALHFIDSLDSKITEFKKYMRDDSNLSGDWTNYIPAIDRKLYKGNTIDNGSESSDE
jgi:3'-5' exoribonuclease